MFDVQGPVNFAELTQAVVSLIGLGIIIWQISHLIRNIQGTTQSSIYEHYTEVSSALLSRPHLWPYFYDKKELPVSQGEEYEKLRAEIDLMSEMVLGLIEHAVLQERNLPRDAWKNCWWPYAKERLRKGTEMRAFFDRNEEWYTDALCALVTMIDQHREPKLAGVRGFVETCKDALGLTTRSHPFRL